jgi:glycosyltransferase involved in cell wall biosynthesis
MRGPQGGQRPRVLYVVYWGALEPLGQSLVVPTATRLAELGAELTLVTFEKPDDTSQPEAVEALRQTLRDGGVKWFPLTYHKGPQLTTKTRDILGGLARGLGCRLRGKIDIVHARTFLGGLMGFVLAPVLGARFVFHSEGFYPDEQVDGGVWREGSFIHRIARRIEERLYRRADAILVLSNRARQAIAARVVGRSIPTVVVPSAVDLNRFRLMPSSRDTHDPTLRLVYAGAVGQRYLFDHAARFAAVAQRKTGRASLRVLTQSEPATVRQLLERSGLGADRWSLAFLPHAEMPTELIRHDAGLSFLAQGLSEHAGSPTKIGEYWASGLPVVTTPNVSDTDDVVRRERVGVVLPDHTEQAYEAGVDRLSVLLEDPRTRERCRRAAERHYSLDAACRRQMDLYLELTRQSTSGD